MATAQSRNAIGDLLGVVACELETLIASSRDGSWPDELAGAARQDPYRLLKYLMQNWHPLYARLLTPRERTLVSEMYTLRNDWAHHRSFDDEDVWRAYDSAARLLRGIGSADVADRLDAEKRGRWAPTAETKASIGSSGRPMAATSRAPVQSSEPERSVEQLDADLKRRASAALRDLVERSGGEHGRAAIAVDHIGVVKELFDAWAVLHGTRDPSGVVRFGPKPGLWHALQGLCPIEVTNRWDRLRKAAVAELEREGWERLSPPRGSIFLISRRAQS